MKFLHTVDNCKKHEHDEPIKLKVDNSEMPIQGITLPRFGDEKEFIGDEQTNRLWGLISSKIFPIDVESKRKNHLK